MDNTCQSEKQEAVLSFTIHLISNVSLIAAIHNTLPLTSDHMHASLAVANAPSPRLPIPLSKLRETKNSVPKVVIADGRPRLLEHFFDQATSKSRAPTTTRWQGLNIMLLVQVF